MPFESLDALRAAAARALTLMDEHHLPVTPANFTVWQTYALGSNPALASTIDVLLSNRQPITDDTLREIEEQFFGVSKTVASIHTVGEKLRNELSQLTAVLSKAGDETAAYGATLSAASGELNAQASGGAVKAIIESLISATQLMESQSRALQSQVHSSHDEVTRLKERIEAVHREALTDPLTGLANRKAFDLELRQAMTQAMESGGPLTLIMADVDHFKLFNDTWGHQTGDQVLRLVARSLKDNIKGRDTAARYGGEEFAVILPETALENGRIVGEQIRRMVESRKIVKKSTGEDMGTITLSLGCAIFEPGEGVSDLIQRADACLYAAKRSGRNKVVVETDIDVASVLGDSSSARSAKIARAANG